MILDSQSMAKTCPKRLWTTKGLYLVTWNTSEFSGPDRALCPCMQHPQLQTIGTKAVNIFGHWDCNCTCQALDHYIMLNSWKLANIKLPMLLPRALKICQLQA